MTTRALKKRNFDSNEPPRKVTCGACLEKTVHVNFVQIDTCVSQMQCDGCAAQWAAVAAFLDDWYERDYPASLRALSAPKQAISRNAALIDPDALVFGFLSEWWLEHMELLYVAVCGDDPEPPTTEPESEPVRPALRLAPMVLVNPEWLDAFRVAHGYASHYGMPLSAMVKQFTPEPLIAVTASDIEAARERRKQVVEAVAA